MRSPRSREELHILPAGPGRLLKVVSRGDTVTNRRGLAKLTDLRPRLAG
ncbi:MAG: hypothetical protein QOF99_2136 [Pseudonocardiales bacterium]|jgi:hypothetical protein|nr:hypothetical protein [Pseudonocardiales bacterium]